MVRSSLWGLTNCCISCKLGSSEGLQGLEHKHGSPGSGVTWPLGGMAGKQIRIIFCAGPGFHLPACRPSTGSAQPRADSSSPTARLSPTLTQVSAPGTSARWQTAARQLLERSVLHASARVCALGSPRCPADASREGWWKRRANVCLDFLWRYYPVTQPSLSQYSDPKGESFFSSTRHLSLPSGRNLSSANSWNGTNNNFGNKRVQSLLPSVKASASSAAWSCLNIDSAPVAGSLPRPHQFWDCLHLMHSGRKAGIEPLERDHHHRTLGKKRLWSCMYYCHTGSPLGRDKDSPLKLFDLTDASQWKTLVKTNWSTFAEEKRSFLCYNSLHLHVREAFVRRVKPMSATIPGVFFLYWK